MTPAIQILNALLSNKTTADTYTDTKATKIRSGIRYRELGNSRVSGIEEGEVKAKSKEAKNKKYKKFLGGLFFIPPLFIFNI